MLLYNINNTINQLNTSTFSFFTFKLFLLFNVPRACQTFATFVHNVLCTVRWFMSISNRRLLTQLINSLTIVLFITFCIKKRIVPFVRNVPQQHGISFMFLDYFSCFSFYSNCLDFIATFNVLVT